MSKEFFQQQIDHYTQLIKKECNKISISFIQLSELFKEKLNFLQQKRNNEYSIELKRKNNIKESKESLINILNKNINKKIEIQEIYGKIKKVNTFDKNRSINIKGYLVIIFYKSVHFSLGPYENYDICLIIKEVIITQLRKKNFCWELNKDKEIYFIDCFNSIKKSIYEKYPPLKGLKKINSINKFEKMQKIETKYNSLEIENQSIITIKKKENINIKLLTKNNEQKKFITK